MQRALQNCAREKRAVPHPRDRSVRQLEKKEKRAARLGAQKTRLKMERAMLSLRFYWFRAQCIALGYTKSAVPDDIVSLLVHFYVDRNKDEVAALKRERNPPEGRIKTLEATLQAEEDELQSAKGLRLPSLSDADDVEILTSIWDGLQDTVAVVPVSTFSMQRRKVPEKAALAQLAQLLQPVQEVRGNAPVALSRSAARFHATQKPNESVKKMASALAATAARMRAREGAAQKKRLTQLRAAAIAAHREREREEK